MKNLDLSKRNTISDKVEINLHMLHALVLYRIRGEIHCADIITVHNSGFARWAVKFL
jgi:hypothetical protein